MAKWGPAKKNGQCWRYGRGNKKFGNSWDRATMEARQRLRRSAILTPAEELAETVRRQKEGGAK